MIDFTALTSREHDSLWWRLIRGAAAALDEAEHLMACPPSLAADLYDGAKASDFQDVALDLLDVVADDMGQRLPPLPGPDAADGWWVTS